jgi:hypothetical protein
MSVVGALADRVTVLQSGRVLVEGGYHEVRTDERVIAAYLGERERSRVVAEPSAPDDRLGERERSRVVAEPSAPDDRPGAVDAAR